MEALAKALSVVVNVPVVKTTYPFVSFSDLYKHRQSGQQVTPHLHSSPKPQGTGPTRPAGREQVGCLKGFCSCMCVRRKEKGYCAPTNVFLSHLDSFLITSLNLKVFGMKPESGSPEAFYHEHSGSVVAVNLPILLVLSAIVHGTVCGIQIHFLFCLIARFLRDANG